MRHRNKNYHKERLLEHIWNAFWSTPVIICPKCKGERTEYYDPFFFSPIRTLSGTRRIQCTSCHFIWRQSRSSRSIWDRFNIR